MKRKFLFSGLLFLMFLGGCRKDASQSASHVVTRIRISCQKEDAQILRHYTDQQKMEYVLLYLRLLQPERMIPVPEAQPTGELYRITLERADGSVTEYRQRDHQYLSKDKAPWQRIDPAQAEGLYRLLRALPSDSL